MYRFNILVIVLLGFLYGQSSIASTVKLITIGPGDAFWSAFGHTAIAIDDDVYGFGYFSFDEDTLPSFVNNSMYYEAGLSDINSEISWAQELNRDFSSIELNLTANEAKEIADYLIWHTQPENLTYQYDYFLNNCSTKIRDVLNRPWNQSLKQQAQETNQGPKENSYFKLTFPAKHQGLMNFGLALGYGWSAYTPKSHWELMALPVYFEQYILTNFSEHTEPRQLIYKAQVSPPVIGFIKTHWFLMTYLLFWSLVLLYKRSKYFMAKIWFVLHGLIGLILLALWLLTPHLVADWNINVLLLSPLGILVPKFKQLIVVIAVWWVFWFGLAVYLGAWYLMPLLLPAFMSMKTLLQRGDTGLSFGDVVQ